MEKPFPEGRAWCFLVLLYVGLRVAVLFSSPGFLYAEEEIYNAALALDVLGPDPVHRLFDYQYQDFDGGTLVMSLLYVPVGLVFGATWFTYKGLAIAVGLVGLWAWASVLRRTHGLMCALLACLLLAASTPVFTTYGLLLWGTHTEASVLAVLCLLLCTHALEDPVPRSWVLALGALCGFGIYFIYSFVLVLVVVLFLFLLARGTRRALPWLLTGALLGFSPWLLRRGLTGDPFVLQIQGGELGTLLFSRPLGDWLPSLLTTPFDHPMWSPAFDQPFMSEGARLTELVAGLLRTLLWLPLLALGPLAWRDRRQGSPRWIPEAFVALLALLIVLTYCLSTQQLPRYLVGLFPLLCVALPMALSSIPDRSRKLGVALCVGAATVGLVDHHKLLRSGALLSPPPRIELSDWRRLGMSRAGIDMGAWEAAHLPGILGYLGQPPDRDRDAGFAMAFHKGGPFETRDRNHYDNERIYTGAYLRERLRDPDRNYREIARGFGHGMLVRCHGESDCAQKAFSASDSLAPDFVLGVDAMARVFEGL